MENYRLEVGDKVRVDINNAQTTVLQQARIEYIPVATGDSWIFTPLDIGGKPRDRDELVYVSEKFTLTYLGYLK